MRALHLIDHKEHGQNIKKNIRNQSCRCLLIIYYVKNITTSFYGTFYPKYHFETTNNLSLNSKKSIKEIQSSKSFNMLMRYKKRV